MKRFPLYMLVFGCGVMFMAVVGAIVEKNEARQRAAVECPAHEPDENSVREQAAICREVCLVSGRSHIAKFDPAPVAHQMTCECKP